MDMMRNTKISEVDDPSTASTHHLNPSQPISTHLNPSQPISTHLNPSQPIGLLERIHFGSRRACYKSSGVIQVLSW